VWAVDALARYLWEQGEGVDIYTDPLEPPGHLVVSQGGGLYPRLLAGGGGGPGHRPPGHGAHGRAGTPPEGSA